MRRAPHVQRLPASGVATGAFPHREVYWQVRGTFAVKVRATANKPESCCDTPLSTSCPSLTRGLIGMARLASTLGIVHGIPASEIGRYDVINFLANHETSRPSDLAESTITLEHSGPQHLPLVRTCPP